VAETIASILQAKGNAVWSIPPAASVYDAIAMMADRRVGALLVMSGASLVGIISERDYARKVILQGRSSKDTPVEEIMTREVMTVTPEHDIDECMRIMTDCTEVVGMISIGDLVRAIISDQAHTIHQLHTYICGSAIVK
jgi:CBS domain-containing protein